jgi:ABC-type polysaccharide/polyol phosphate transport system ATPase subunit
MHIKVENLSITYFLKSPNDGFLRRKMLNKLLKKEQEENKLIYALQNLNFELKEGDRLGIVGPNGSGKSTLIKCLSGIIFPNEDSIIDIHGKCLSIIDPGALAETTDTILNNIIIIGLLLGFEKKTILKKINGILEFSELDDYANHRFSTLSTGMKLKLLFSIVFILDSEIFLIDEFLTTGDEKFRKKGLQLLEKTKNNSILVLCSHDRSAIKEFCNKILVLNKGKQEYFGAIEDGYKVYDKLMSL